MENFYTEKQVLVIRDVLDAPIIIGGNSFDAIVEASFCRFGGSEGAVEMSMIDVGTISIYLESETFVLDPGVNTKLYGKFLAEAIKMANRKALNVPDDKWTSVWQEA